MAFAFFIQLLSPIRYFRNPSFDYDYDYDYEHEHEHEHEKDRRPILGAFLIPPVLLVVADSRTPANVGFAHNPAKPNKPGNFLGLYLLEP
jgi:hypothetical protein